MESSGCHGDLKASHLDYVRHYSTALSSDLLLAEMQRFL